MHATLSNQSTQSYPEDVGASYPARTSAVENNTLGYTWPGIGPMDSVYHLDFTFDHSNNTARLDFSGIGLQEIADESWGLDNVAVWAINNP